jgi:hypothetical protein
MYWWYQHTSVATDYRWSKFSLLISTGTGNNRVDTLLQNHLKLRISQPSPLRLQTLYHDTLVQWLILSYPHNFWFFGLWVPGWVPILKILLNPLSEKLVICIIWQYDHLIVVVHVPKYEFKVVSIAAILTLDCVFAAHLIVFQLQ